jgi:hypothetical protein
MRFYKAKIIILSSFLVVGFLVTPSYADNANPPIVKSLEEVTTGPYSVGDIITFKVTYEGGNPGIKLIKISGVNNSQTCVGQGIPPDNFDGQTVRSLSVLAWNNKSALKKNSNNYELVSGFVLPCRKVSNSSTGAIVLIEDETGLQNSKFFSYTLTTISDDLFTPVGEIKPIKIADQISIKNIPKSPKKNIIYKLPRLTQGGVPVFWFVPTGKNNPRESVCSIEKTFEGDLGGSLKFKKSGSCILNAWPQLTDKFAYPTYSAQTPLTIDERSGEKNSFVYKVK